MTISKNLIYNAKKIRIKIKIKQSKLKNNLIYLIQIFINKVKCVEFVELSFLEHMNIFQTEIIYK